MTAPHIVDPHGLLSHALSEASPDLLRDLLQNTINMLLSADADLVAGTEYGRPRSERNAQRNGYRHRFAQTPHPGPARDQGRARGKVMRRLRELTMQEALPRERALAIASDDTSQAEHVIAGLNDGLVHEDDRGSLHLAPSR